MGVFKNEVGRPSNETIKKRNIMKSILLIIAAIGIFLIGYFLNSYLTNKENIIANEIAENNELSKQDVEKIISNVFTTNEYDFEHWLLLYDVNGKGSNFDINSNKFKLGIAIEKTQEIKNKYSCYELFKNEKLITYFIEKDLEYSNLRCEEESRQFSYDEVDATFKKIFGNGLYAPKESINSYLTAFAFIKEKNMYVELFYDAGDGGYPVVSGIIDYKQKDNKLYVTYGIARAEDGSNLELSDGSFEKISIDENNYEVSSGKYFDIYKEKLFKYELEFEKENENYIFKSINK